MKKKFLVFLLVIASFAGGYFVGSQRGTDPVRSASPTVISLSQAVITSAPTKQKYILNRKTKKFHLPSCSSVKQMLESNKIESSKSREEIIADGYDPCGRCHP